MARKPVGDLSGITQVDMGPSGGVYKDPTGAFFTGTWDNPVYRGTSYTNGVFGGGDEQNPPVAGGQPDYGTGGPLAIGGGQPDQGITDPNQRILAGGPTTIDTNKPIQPQLPDQRWPGGQSPYTGTSTGGGGTPPSNGDPMSDDYIRQWVDYHANQPGANPSTKNDPNYWVQKIKETGGWQGDNANYWSSPRGMYRVEGAPEGLPSDPGYGQAGGGTNPNQVLDYNGATNYIQSKLGRALSPQETAAAFAKFGGNTSSSFTPAGLDQVVQYFKGSGGTGGGLQPNGNPTGFADPAYQGLMDLVTQRLKNLSQPQQFPQLDSYMSMLRGNQDTARARAQTFADQMTSRIGQLQAPLLTDANVANQRALASNSTLAARDATLKNQRERRFAQGFEPTSGLLAGDERAINENASNAQANIDAQLQRSSIAQDEQRRNQASTLQGLVAQALQGGDVSALQSAAQMSDLENQVYNIGEQRQRESLTTGNIPVDLTNMGFSNANNAAGARTDPMASIMQLLGLANGQQQQQQAGQNSNMSALAWLLQQALG